jgi:hypothetical protein
MLEIFATIIIVGLPVVIVISAIILEIKYPSHDRR